MTIVFLNLAFGICLAGSDSPPLDRCVPADAMAVYFGRPTPEMLAAGANGTVDQLAGWIITFKAMGLIPREGRAIADLVGTLPLLGRRPHALVLLDVTAKQIEPDVYRLNSLQSALMIDSEGIAAELDRRVRDLLATYADAENCRVDVVQYDALQAHRLTDKRLPDWAVTEWGVVRGYFVVAVGDGAFEKVADTIQGQHVETSKRRNADTGATSERIAQHSILSTQHSTTTWPASLADDSWFSRAHARCRGATSGIEVFADFARIKNRVGEVAQGRPVEVMGALQLERADRLLWTVGFDGRALHSEVMAQEAQGRDLYRMLTSKETAPVDVTAAIPVGAARYAAFHFPLAGAVRNMRDAYLNSQSADKRQRLHDAWELVQKEFHFDVETELLDRLDQDIVFHTYPPHPLGVPFLFTIWIRYVGERTSMAATIDSLMAAWQKCMNVPSATRPTSKPARNNPLADGFSPRVSRGAEGIWYLQIGLAGPAIAVADGWIVMSYSPEAVQQNLQYLKSGGEGRRTKDERTN